MKLNVKPGDRVVRVSPAGGFSRANIQHGNVIEVGDGYIKCKILADVWCEMTFNEYGLDKFGYNLLAVDTLRWLFDDNTTWWRE